MEIFDTGFTMKIKSTEITTELITKLTTKFTIELVTD